MSLRGLTFATLQSWKPKLLAKIAIELFFGALVIVFIGMVLERSKLYNVWSYNFPHQTIVPNYKFATGDLIITTNPKEQPLVLGHMAIVVNASPFNQSMIYEFGVTGASKTLLPINQFLKFRCARGDVYHRSLLGQKLDPVEFRNALREFEDSAYDYIPIIAHVGKLLREHLNFPSLPVSTTVRRSQEYCISCILRALVKCGVMKASIAYIETTMFPFVADPKWFVDPNVAINEFVEAPYTYGSPLLLKKDVSE